MLYQTLEGEAVTRRPEPHHSGKHHIRDEAVVSEGLAPVHIREVDLDDGQPHRQESVAERHGRVSIGGRVQDQAVGSIGSPPNLTQPRCTCGGGA